MADAPHTARAQARAALTAEIKATARRHLGEVGAAGLSLRAVAREMGLASSAVYRYFPSRDALLTALIVDAFDAVGERAEAAVAAAPARFEARWAALAGAVRAWALEHPHDYALVYGSPVPGYEAPQDTVDPAARVSLAMLGIVADGLERGEIDPTPTAPVPRAVHRDLARLRDVAAPGVPDEVLLRALQAWTGLFGEISYLLFGHLHGVIDSVDPYFELQVARAGRVVLSGAAASPP
jgi:AcrR family transcriptional regulator